LALESGIVTTTFTVTAFKTTTATFTITTVVTRSSKCFQAGKLGHYLKFQNPLYSSVYPHYRCQTDQHLVVAITVVVEEQGLLDLPSYQEGSLPRFQRLPHLLPHHLTSCPSRNNVLAPSTRLNQVAGIHPG